MADFFIAILFCHGCSEIFFLYLTFKGMSIFTVSYEPSIHIVSLIITYTLWLMQVVHFKGSRKRLMLESWNFFSSSGSDISDMLCLILKSGRTKYDF